MGAWDAVARRTSKRQCGRYHVVGEADIKGCFDHSDHAWLMRMWRERLDDGAFRRLTRKGLRAGGLDPEGQVLHPGTGTPPGGMISPSLANVSRHEALARWVHKVVKPRCGGDACLMRDADDGGGACQSQADAERCYQEVGQRLGQFGPEVSPAKTRVIPLTWQQGPGPTSVDVLGFEFRWGRDRAGTPHLKRRTSRRQLRNSLQRVPEWCKQKCRSRLKALFRELTAKWRGDSHAEGVHGHAASLHEFFPGVLRRLFQWLHRRSQRRS